MLLTWFYEMVENTIKPPEYHTDTCHITFIDNTNIELSIKYKFNS